MPGALTAAGAAPEPSQYAPLTMDRYITGLWTQRSPLRDADVPYLYAKFYSASRFDSLIDGLNRELTARLTIQRRCGTSLFSATTLGPINTYYSFNAVQQIAQQIYVMSDTSAEVYYTVSGATGPLFTKSAGAGISRFLGVGPSLFFGNGKDQKKWLQYGAWPGANTAVAPGTFVTDVNNNVQMALGGITLDVTASMSNGATVTLWFDPLTVPLQFADLQNVNITLAGLTAGAALNGMTIPVGLIVSSTLGQLSFNQAITAYAKTNDTGTATTGTGTTGGAAPAWGDIYLGITADGGQQWKCYASALQNWTPAAPKKPPTLALQGGARTWLPGAALSSYTSILDPNGNIQVLTGGGGLTGLTPPNWATTLAGVTKDGGFTWWCAGTLGSWSPGIQISYYAAIVDSNGNIQVAVDVVAPGDTGTGQPAWNATLGDTTTDNNITWQNFGPGTILATGTISYAYSYKALDGSVSTSSPMATLAGGILGPSTGAGILLNGVLSTDKQVDQIWWWRTPQGGPTLLQLDAMPGEGPQASYVDQGIPDTSIAGGPSLDALVSAPINSANNAPAAGFTAPVYHMSRVWGIVGSTVYYSGGPDTVVGNGNTAFAPLSSFTFPELITKLVPITVNNGGLLCLGTRNVYIILGTGTPSNPFYDTTYMPTVGFMGYDAICLVGSTLYGFTSNRKFVSLDPSAGYVECGFPIGDQFTYTSTGNAFGGVPVGALYNPATTYVSWNERESGDSGIYVADGAVGWFRYSPVAAPESGYLWSPRAVITGGTSAVLSVETAPGVQTLLIGPSAAGGEGPITMRDPTVFTDYADGAPTNYANSYVTIGNIVLCEPGEVAEIAFVTLDSINIGAQPQIGMLYGEIAATATVPFDMIDVTSPDPPDLPESETLFNDRYMTMHDGVCPKCRHCQVMITWPAQGVGDELLAHAIYGAKYAERKEQ